MYQELLFIFKIQHMSQEFRSSFWTPYNNLEMGKWLQGEANES